MRNVQANRFECQNVEHHCGNCVKNSGKRAPESEETNSKNLHSHHGMAEDDEIDQVPGAFGMLDQLQSID